MGFFTFFRDLLFGTPEENEIIRKQRWEERRRDLERAQEQREYDLATYQRISRVDLHKELEASRERTRELLDTEIKKRKERELEHERRYRELGRKKLNRLPQKFKPK